MNLFKVVKLSNLLAFPLLIVLLSACGGESGRSPADNSAPDLIEPAPNLQQTSLNWGNDEWTDHNWQ